MRTASKREAFADILVNTCKEYDLDGLDIDWGKMGLETRSNLACLSILTTFSIFTEYPNDPNGVSCNEKDEDDTPNFLAFLKVLRKKLDAAFKGEHKWLSASVGATVLKGSDQEPLTKLSSGWDTALDAFQIMASGNN